MVGHYVFNASAIGLGGVLTTPKRKIIPSLASVHLAPTGGEGSACVTNYDDGDGISFDRAETRVWGSSHSGNIYATRADVMVNNLDVFNQLQVESMWASVTSIREVQDNGDVLDRRFTFQAEFLGVRVNGREIDVPVDMKPFDDNASYDDFLNALGTAEMSDYRKLIGIDEEASQSLLQSRRAAYPANPLTIRCTGLSPKGKTEEGGFHVKVRGLGKAHLAEALIKPGHRRLTLLRLELTEPTMRRIASDSGLSSLANDSVMLSQSLTGGSGSMSVGSVEGNGTNSWPP
jgi:hypothetical protein